MVALWNRADHYIFPCGFFPSFFFFHRLISSVGDWMSAIIPHMVWPQCEFRMQVWNVLHAARWKYRTQKIAICPPSYNFVGLYLRNEGTYRQSEKNLLSSDISSRCPHNMVNFSLLAAEIGWRLWGTPANFNGFHVLAALLHGSQVVGVSQTLRHWTTNFQAVACHFGRLERIA